MGWLKKLTKPISKVLDKIIPNEIKPALPYLSAFAPFMMGPTSGIMGSSMLRRGLMSGALNLGSQLAQEGSEGEFDPLSLAIASGIGALTAPGTPGGRTIPGTDGMSYMEYVATPEAGLPSGDLAYRGAKLGTPSAQQFFETAAEGMDKGMLKSGTQMLGKGAKYLSEASKTFQDAPFSKEG